MFKRKLTIVPGSANPELLNLSKEDWLNKTGFIAGNDTLNDPRLHMFVASCQWDELVLGLTTESNFDRLLPMLSKFAKLTIHILSEPNQEVVNFLCNVYPEKQGVLRKAFMLKKPLTDVLD